MADWLAGTYGGIWREEGGLLGAGFPLSAETLLGALLGALLALGLSRLIAHAWRRFARGRRHRSAARPLPCGDSRCGLEEFSREVEERLDAKLDRLQEILADVDRVLGRSPRTAPASGSRPVSPSPRLADPENGDLLRGAPNVEGDQRPITEEERERVIALAADGATPETISESVGLLRGEVDLILRLYGREA
jgi:hypothetical protein